MNSWRSPQGVRFRHFPDQISHLGAHSGTAGSPAPGDPGPVKPEPSSRPAHDRLWVDNQQGPSPVTPNPGQPDPKPAVHLSQPRSRTLRFHHRQLLTEGQILQSQFLDVRRGQKETKDRKQELEHADEYHGCVGESQLFSGGSNSDEPHPAQRWAPWPICHPSRREAKWSMLAQTYSASARYSTKWPLAGWHFQATPPP